MTEAPFLRGPDLEFALEQRLSYLGARLRHALIARIVVEEVGNFGTDEKSAEFAAELRALMGEYAPHAHPSMKDLERFTGLCERYASPMFDIAEEIELLCLKAETCLAGPLPSRASS